MKPEKPERPARPFVPILERELGATVVTQYNPDATSFLVSEDPKYLVLGGSVRNGALSVLNASAGQVYDNDFWEEFRFAKRPDLVYVSVLAEPPADFVERLTYAAKFEIVAPIFVSSFTEAFPAHGCIWPFDVHFSKKRRDAGETNPYDINTFGLAQQSPEVRAHTYDFARVRWLLEDKFKFNEHCGTWPPDEIFQLTMFAKIYRMERKKLKWLKEQEAFSTAFAV